MLPLTSLFGLSFVVCFIIFVKVNIITRCCPESYKRPRDASIEKPFSQAKLEMQKQGLISYDPSLNKKYKHIIKVMDDILAQKVQSESI
jgi:hypothetical protein